MLVYTWLSLFMQVWLDIICLIVSLSAVMLFLPHDLLNEACCPCFVSLSLPPAPFLMYSNEHSHAAHTQQTPPLACVDVQPSTNHHAAFILSSTSNHGRSLAAVSSSFFSLRVSAKGFMIPLEAMLNLTDCDLGKVLHCTSNRYCFIAIWKQAPAINLLLFRLCYCTVKLGPVEQAMDHRTRLLYTIA